MILNRHALDAWRVERGFSKQELADATGLDRTTVSKILSGQRNASPAFIVAAASALKVRKIVLLADPDAVEGREEAAV